MLTRLHTQMGHENRGRPLPWGPPVLSLPSPNPTPVSNL